MMPAATPIEEPCRLSRSVLWKYQRRYFESRGIAAWTEGIVPQDVTSNPWMANAYAHLVTAWMREQPEDDDEPFTVIELGCGSGRFGYRFVRSLSRLTDRPFTYIFTDFSDANLDVLRSHPALQALVAQGRVDFARFDVERDDAIKLTESGRAVRRGQSIAVIANYVFDSLPCDCFHLRGGKLSEILVRVSSEDEEPDVDADDWMRRLSIAYDERPVFSGYDDAAWNAVVNGYRHTLSDGILFFPTGALEAIARLHALAGDRLLMLIADYGDLDENNLGGRDAPAVDIHGSFSMAVNFDAVGKIIAARGGRMLHASHSNPLAIVACMFGPRMFETERAFFSFVEELGADDFFTMKKAVERHYGAMSLAELLAFLRLSGCDHTAFLSCFTRLMDLTEGADAIERRDIRAAVLRTAEEWFPLPERVDVAYHAAVLLEAADYPADALPLYEESMRLYGPSHETVANIARCRRATARPE